MHPLHQAEPTDNNTLTAEVPRHILREKLQKALAYYAIESDGDRQERERSYDEEREKVIAQYMQPEVTFPAFLWYPAKIKTRTRQEAEAIFDRCDKSFYSYMLRSTSHNEYRHRRLLEIAGFVDNEDLVHIRLSEKDLRMLDL